VLLLAIGWFSNRLPFRNAKRRCKVESSGKVLTSVLRIFLSFFLFIFLFNEQSNMHDSSDEEGVDSLDILVKPWKGGGSILRPYEDLRLKETEEQELSSSETETLIQDSSKYDNSHHRPDMPEFSAEPKRWIQLLLYSSTALMNAILWIAFSPISNEACKFYGVDPIWINMLSAVYFIAYIPGVFIASWILDNLGLRWGITCGV
jgi:hypothetical protein